MHRPPPIRQVPPVYPLLARTSHNAGDVVIEAILDENGNVTDIKVISGAVSGGVAGVELRADLSERDSGIPADDRYDFVPP